MNDLREIEYPITGKVWFRKSTNEWVVEVEGTIDDVSFVSRHTQPHTVHPADVPGLPNLYERLEAAEETIPILKFLFVMGFTAIVMVAAVVVSVMT